MVVMVHIITDNEVPPDLVNEARVTNHEGVVHFVVVADPAAAEAPHSFDGGVSAEAANFGCFAAYTKVSCIGYSVF